MWEVVAAGAVLAALSGGPPSMDLRTAAATQAIEQRAAAFVSSPAGDLSGRAHPRSKTLTAMYVAFGALQLADVHSTTRALSRGAVEANPAMRTVAGSPAALIAVKAAGGATTILVSEKLRKKRPVAALVLMASLNSFLAAVVAHNYRVP